VNRHLALFNFDSCEGSGDLLADSDIAEGLWGDGESSLEVTGNEGVTRETLYSAYFLLMYRPEPPDPAKKRART
jgi:hypothetical protein